MELYEKIKPMEDEISSLKEANANSIAGDQPSMTAWGKNIYTDLKTDDLFMFNLLLCWLLTVSELQKKLEQSKSQLQGSKLQLEQEGRKSYNLSKKSS